MSQPVKRTTRPPQTSKEKSRLRAKARQRRRRITVIFLSCLLIFIVGIVLKIMIPKEAIAELFRGSTLKEQNILLLGVDYNYDPQGNKVSPDTERTDTMLLAHVDPANHLLNIISLPRDTRVLIPEHGVNKLNAAHAFGGPQLAMETVETLLGINIDHYMRIDLRKAEALFNLMGALDIYVEEPMHYVDHTAKLDINFEPGWHQMKGHEAIAYARFRYDALGDIGRVQRQQAVMNAIQQKLSNPLNWWRLPRLVSAGFSSLKTDMKLNEISDLAHFAKDREHLSTHFVTLPGDFGHSGYWIPNVSRIATLQDLLFTAKSSNPESPAPENCTVAILYDPKLADRIESITNNLNNTGLQVITSQPLDSEDSTTSRVIAYDHYQNWEDKLRGATAGLPWQFSDERSTYSADYTVILGTDYR